ncbi:MAG: sensor histidine kinase [Chloroflexi bacterium]|nr:sensor histidine kinase [Chloroflexota bacterium]
MEKNKNIRRKIKELFIPPGEENLEEFKEIAPFFILITIVLGFMYVQSVNSSTELNDPWRLGVFSILFFLHILLYWMAINLSYSVRRTYVYLSIQGILALFLVLISLHPPLVVSLFAALIGKGIGIIGNRRRSVIAVAYFVTLALFSFMLSSDLFAAEQIVSTFIPAIIFVIIFIVLFNRQIEARDRARTLLKELEVAHSRLAEYTLQVEDLTLKAERQRMARELHDTLAQGLAGLVLQLEAVDSHLEGGTYERADEIVQQAMTRARATLADSRKAIDDLRMERFGVQDLRDELVDVAAKFEHTNGISCELELDLPQELSQTLIENTERAVIESLRNVAKHAKASNVSLKIQAHNDILGINIKDDGIGFEVESAFSLPGHYGLLGLRERAKLAGGSLSIVSAPNNGTEIHMQLPLIGE